MVVSTDRLLSVLTGAVGDLLAARGNGLHEPMAVVVGGEAVALDGATLAARFPTASDHVVVLVHGLMGTTEDFGFAAHADDRTDDYGGALASAWGWTPVFLRYNSGLELADNGAALAGLLARLVADWPVAVAELALVAHSMGGLVVRWALAQAPTETRSWRSLVQRVALLATPHGGAPLERAGRAAVGLARQLPDPVAQLIAQVADLRSAGIVGLGQPVLPAFSPDFQYFLAAGRLWGEGPWTDWLGDGMVPVASALATGETLPAGTETTVLDGTNHAQMAHHPELRAKLVVWLQPRCAVAVQKPPFPEQPAPPPSPSRARRWLGLGHLAVQSVAAGNRAVARVRLARAEQVFAALQAVPALAPAVGVTRTLHDAVVVAGHAPVAVAVAAAEVAVEVAGVVVEGARGR